MNLIDVVMYCYFYLISGKKLFGILLQLYVVLMLLCLNIILLCCRGIIVFYTAWLVWMLHNLL
jgi:hypothetical protein